MTDNNSSNRLPQMPRLNKLPSLHSAKPTANSMVDLPKLSPSPVIPALQSSATQLPNVQMPQADESEATMAIQAPSDSDIEKAMSSIKTGGKASLPGLGIPLIGSQVKKTSLEDTNGPTVALKAPKGNDIDKAVENIHSSAKPSLPGFSSPLSRNKGLASIPSMPVSQSPMVNPEPDGDISSLASNRDFSKNYSSSQPISPFEQKPQQQVYTPPQEEEPIFGGAALGNDELQYEDELPDSENEKTMMIDAADDDIDDIGNEKTQISFGAMDYEPLSGKLIVESGKTNQREYLLVREKNSIGRAPSNDIAIADIAMSRKHVEIDKFPEGFRIRDLESGNGTIVNDHRIRVAQLRNGDIIEIGSIRFRFEQSGGDPDVLWKGDPIIDYHPNQRNKRPSSSEQPQNQNAQRSSSQNPPAYRSSSSQQMESMLERQGGGIAAPTWSAPHMTSPYISYNGNVLRTVNSIPTASLIVFVVSIVFFIGSIAFLLFGYFNKESNNKKIEAQQTLAADINNSIAKGLDAYSKSQFTEAISHFNNAKNLDPNQIILKDTSFIEKYNDLIAKEESISKDIKQINDKLMGIRNSADYTSDEYSKDLSILQKVSDSSVNKNGADQTIIRITEAYVNTLRKKIGDLIKEEKISEAKKLIRELAKFQDPDNSATNFANRIATIEQRNSSK